jgi:hypothetical protein
MRFWHNWLSLFLVMAIMGVAQVVPAYADEYNSIRLSGQIDSDTLEQLRAYDGRQLSIEVILLGGRVDYALDAAELAARNSWDVKVIGACWSACAEIFLLGFDEVVLGSGAFLGFHGNSKSKNYLYRLASGDPDSECFLEHEHRRDALIQLRGVDPDFWKIQLEHLNVLYTVVNFDTGAACGTLKYDTEYKLWVPSTDELLSYGLNIVGEQWSDDVGVREFIKALFVGAIGNINITGS